METESGTPEDLTDLALSLVGPTLDAMSVLIVAVADVTAMLEVLVQELERARTQSPD